jgi:hypothetical protein
MWGMANAAVARPVVERKPRRLVVIDTRFMRVLVEIRIVVLLKD